jgi:hypothetical protein
MVSKGKWYQPYRVCQFCGKKLLRTYYRRTLGYLPPMDECRGCGAYRYDGYGWQFRTTSNAQQIKRRPVHEAGT